jgi:hypothetical protein
VADQAEKGALHSVCLTWLICSPIVRQLCSNEASTKSRTYPRFRGRGIS